ncbi:MAG: hypothetical protein Q4F75_04460, partial [Pseudomonadota bacterium]|nr:hypothetical protein [Pseudomonadota bacterium]
MRISRVILMSTLSLIGLKVDLAYADIHLSVPVAGIHTHNTLTLNHPLLSSAQSGNRHNLILPLSRGSKNSPDFVRLEFSRGYESRKGQLGIITPLLTSPTLGEEYKEASVCFITDTGECSDNKFG